MDRHPVSLCRKHPDDASHSPAARADSETAEVLAGMSGFVASTSTGKSSHPRCVLRDTCFAAQAAISRGRVRWLLPAESGHDIRSDRVAGFGAMRPPPFPE